ncbi:uncharacterized protein EI97DRAFT_445659 [Westerdykella ornata]|uniref:Zn(2)-C6 fungal-type domain-containing protein n=1 Tax=Westerdykella ornata TaxID=318751 RepID=A0A6A6J9D5_WESOR|nr:uncharacterized protein EI97DRAFT_445659 [Westerdykella ornata]KAF2272588.1 hypothetical protein EI97DRAFT_445659 [Westerdykella ornata]
MPSTDSDSPDDTFFNDLSQPVPQPNRGSHSSQKPNATDAPRDDASKQPKRIACVLCRKRKLKCDGTRPACGTCKRLSHDCAYDEVRKKSGPKRGYVKLLEARLRRFLVASGAPSPSANPSIAEQVETLLKNHESTEQNKESARQNPASAYVASTLQQGLLNPGDGLPPSFTERLSPAPDMFPGTASAQSQAGQGEYPWEMIGLGLDEPLPPQDVMDDLYQVYFSKIHHSVPVIHKPRFRAAMDLAPHMRPAVCLRYIMWALAASITDKYETLQEHFYQRARKYAHMDEMRGYGEATITVGHCQAWILICTYEFKQMYFPRAWMSAGRAVRLAQMMQLHRLDGAGLDVKQSLGPPKDWTEREERRRTFWMAFCVDRYASIGTGWPMTIDERDILTNLPSSEEAYEKSKPMPTGSLEQAMEPNGAAKLEPFAGVIVTAALFGRNLLHLHRPGIDDMDHDLNGGFWSRHRELESILLNTALALPDALRLPGGLSDPNVVFLNMALHTSAICLHQAAIFKADKYRLPIAVSNESKIRCVTAAAEVASVMRMISHMDLSAMNPFISFCVYVAARVFIQYLKTRPKDQQMSATLQFMLQAMAALRRKNPLTESFLAQLDVDLESAGLMGLGQRRSTGSLTDTKGGEDLTTRRRAVAEQKQGCAPITIPTETQNKNAQANYPGNPRPEMQGSADAGYTGSTPGPPFHVNNSAVNLDTHHSLPFVRSQKMDIPQRGRQTDPTRYPALYMVPDNNDMDVSTDDQPSPATSNSQSRGGSTSHTSYSPRTQNDIHSMPYRASPKRLSNTMPLAQTSAADNTTFFPANDPNLFSADLYDVSASMTADTTMSSGFVMTSEWDLSMMSTGNTGMTPMSDGAWNQMLESIDLGWNSMGPPHGESPIGGR